MVFDPEKQTLSCPFCGTYVDFDKDDKVREKDLEDAFSVAEKWTETSVVFCDNCGAKFVIDDTFVASSCPYCGTSHVRKSEDLAGVKPNAVYPFSFPTGIAEKLSKKWVKRRLFAPKKFKKSVEARNIHGVYEPCFTFDSNTVSVYDGRLGRTRTRTVRTKNGTRTETYVEWRYVSGTFSHFFDDVTISAGEGLPQKQYDKLKPFDQSAIKVYKKDYLAGFVAKHYDVGLKECWERSKTEMDGKIRSMIVSMYHCDVVGYLNVRTAHNDVTFKYVLLPIYILNYRFKKKDYKIKINGTTGKILGKTPVSPLRVLIAVLLGLAVTFGVFLLFYLLGSTDYALINSFLIG